MNNRAPRALRLAPMMVAPLSLLLLSAPLHAAGTTVTPAAPSAARPAQSGPQSQGQPADDEVVELPSEPARPPRGRADLNLQTRLEQLEQKNEELSQRVQELNQRLNITSNPTTAVRINGYIDAGFFTFFRGTGSGITNYLGKTVDPSAPLGLLPKWHFLGDPLATAINSAGHPADVMSQNNPGQSSLAVPYDYIQSGGHPTFIINELNITPTAKFGDRFQAIASLNFYPRSASVSIADKNDGGSVRPAGPTNTGDYLFADLAFLEYNQSFAGGRHRLSVFAGRFDPNIGIEYRVRKSPDRFGVTPSLLCRYSCGTPIGLKLRALLFDEVVSVAFAVHNSASYQEQLFRFGADTDKKYMKTLSGRVSVKAPVLGGVEVGLSGEFGGQVDGFYDVSRSEFDPFTKQWTVDVDLHLEYRGFELRGEFLQTRADGHPGGGSKPALPRLEARGVYLEGSYRATNWLGLLLRWDFRDALHTDYTAPFLYDALLWRLTLGARVDINDSIAVKAEYLHLQPFGRMANLLDESAAAAPNGGAYAGDYLTTSLVLKY